MLRWRSAGGFAQRKREKEVSMNVTRRRRGRGVKFRTADYRMDLG